MVNAIDCFDVVVVSRVAYQLGPNLVKIDNTSNTRHCSIHNNALLALLLPTSRHVVGSACRTRMHGKEIVGQGRMDGFTTTCHSRHSIKGDIERTEERSVHSVGHVGNVCTIDLGESWASGHIGIVDPLSINSWDDSWQYKRTGRIIMHYRAEVQAGGPWIWGENHTCVQELLPLQGRHAAQLWSVHASPFRACQAHSPDMVVLKRARGHTTGVNITTLVVLESCHHCLTAEAPYQGLDGGRVRILEGVKITIMVEERVNNQPHVPGTPRLRPPPVDMVEGTLSWGCFPE
jgi:hypothetical protein